MSKLYIPKCKDEYAILVRDHAEPRIASPHEVVETDFDEETRIGTRTDPEGNTFRVTIERILEGRRLAIVDGRNNVSIHDDALSTLGFEVREEDD